MAGGIFLKPGDVLGDCTVQEQLGFGTVGITFAVKDQEGRQYVLKEVSPVIPVPGAFEAFSRQIAVVSTIVHPALVQIHQVIQAPEIPQKVFLFTEYVQGQSLSALLDQSAQYDAVELSLLVAEQSAAALEALFRAGVCHGNLHPGNIFLTIDRKLKLSDAGMSSLLPCERLFDGSLAGAVWDHLLRYTAPERLSGGQANICSDIYSLGLCLYSIVAGKRPFEGMSRQQIFSMLLTRELPEPATLRPDFPPLLNQLIVQMTARQPDKRPQSAEEILQQIRAIRAALQQRGQAPLPSPSPASGEKAIPRLKYTPKTVPQIVPMTPLPESKPKIAVRPIENKPVVPSMPGARKLPVPPLSGDPVPADAETASRVPKKMPIPPVSVPAKPAEPEPIINEMNLPVESEPFSWSQIGTLLSVFAQKLRWLLQQTGRDLGKELIGFGIAAVIFGLGARAVHTDAVTVSASLERPFAVFQQYREESNVQKKKALEKELAAEGYWPAIQKQLSDPRDAAECIEALKRTGDPDALLTAATLMMMQPEQRYQETEWLEVLALAAQKGSAEAAGFLRTWHEAGGDPEKAGFYRQNCLELYEQREAALPRDHKEQER